MFIEINYMYMGSRIAWKTCFLIPPLNTFRCSHSKNKRLAKRRIKLGASIRLVILPEDCNVIPNLCANQRWARWNPTPSIPTRNRSAASLLLPKSYVVQASLCIRDLKAEPCETDPDGIKQIFCLRQRSLSTCVSCEYDPVNMISPSFCIINIVIIFDNRQHPPPPQKIWNKYQYIYKIKQYLKINNR